MFRFFNRYLKFTVHDKPRIFRPADSHWYKQWVLAWRWGPIFGRYEYPSQTTWGFFWCRKFKQIRIHLKRRTKNNMMYKSKPIEMEAIRYTGDNYPEIKEFVGSDDIFRWDGTVTVTTNNGRVELKLGHFICKGKSDFYPCDPETFHSRWEVVQQSDDN